MKKYRHMCDASAGIAIDDIHILVAEDETEIIRLYRNDNFAEEPLRSFDLSEHLHGKGDRECDIEGAARLGDSIYWITSHGRNKKGKYRPNRHRLFVTDISGSEENLELNFIGRYDRLIEDLLNPEQWASPKSASTKKIISVLRDATQLERKKAPELAPKIDGLNIESLAINPKNSELLFGLRNPTPDNEAVIISIKNADDLLRNPGKRAEFSNVSFLDLGGLGIRSLSRVPGLGSFIILAGPRAKKGKYKFYCWGGTPRSKLTEMSTFKGGQYFRPEALIVYGDSIRIQVLNDLGSASIEGSKCKGLPEKKKYFTDRWYQLE